MSVNFDWKDPNRLLSEVDAMLRTQNRRFQRVPEMAVRRGTFELLALVKKLVPKVTSTLVRSISATVEKIGTDIVEGKVGTWLEYAKWIEEGTGILGPLKRPILITAKAKKALYWGRTDDNGRPLIRKRVLNPGMKAQAPFGRAIAQFLPRYVRIIEEELAKEAA